MSAIVLSMKSLWLQKLSEFRMKNLLMPILGIVVFLFIWQVGAEKVDTSLGKFPGPVAVYEQWQGLIDDHQRERTKEASFYERQEKRNADRVAKDPSYQPKIREYTGKPTFFDQIFTSLYTVLAGFGLATVIAIPLGILVGLNSMVYSALNPVIQIFKPVSPLANVTLFSRVATL
jgi:nitrate/nitrite transport system permease protein